MEGNNGSPVPMPLATHKYRCDICNDLFSPEMLVEHVGEEKAKPTWPGEIHFHLELGPFDE